MTKIAILGNQDTILGFKALGVDTFSITNLIEAQESLKKIKQENYGIVFITEDWLEKLSEAIKELKKETLPAVIAIPCHTGTTGYGVNNLKKIVERAVGSDILSKQ